VVGYCDLELRRSEFDPARLYLNCAVVENQDPHDRRRLQIVDEQIDVIRKLKHWLKAS
jgi:hypothetical protein